jgi:formylglycine-generating enzyme required for sulfatase activity
LGADAMTLITKLKDEELDVTIRQALLLSLGEFDTHQLPRTERQALIPDLVELYQKHPDPGLLGAAEWLLRHWGQEKMLAGIHKELPKGRHEGKPQWYVNTQGQTMVVIPGPLTIRTGSPPDEKDRTKETGKKEDETQRWWRIDRTFAIAAKEVTVAQFKKSQQYKANKWSPEPDNPVNKIHWYEAAAYCNWLSRQEGLDPCYEGEGAATTLHKKYLKRSGYRLPTEPEWECACRAGTVTSRYYGSSEGLLGNYAWYCFNVRNRTEKVGTKKPNDWGLFDMHGNVAEWCLSQPAEGSATGSPTEPLLDKMDPRKSGEPEKPRRYATRDGGFYYLPMLLRCATTYGRIVEEDPHSSGFRVVRTLRTHGTK